MKPDITRTITETVEKLVHTYLAKIDKPRNNTELEAYNKRVDKLTEVAVHKLVTLYKQGKIDELKRAASHNNSEYTSDYLEDRIKELSQ